MHLAGVEAGNAEEGAASAQQDSTALQNSPSANDQQQPETKSPPLATEAAAASQTKSDSGGAAAGIGAHEVAAVTQDAGTGAQEAKAATQLHGSCQDLEEGCVEWAAEDGCIQNGPSFMFERCRKSCGVCDQPIITDVPENVRPLFLFAHLRLCIRPNFQEFVNEIRASLDLCSCGIWGPEDIPANLSTYFETHLSSGMCDRITHGLLI